MRNILTCPERDQPCSQTTLQRIENGVQWRNSWIIDEKAKFCAHTMRAPHSGPPLHKILNPPLLKQASRTVELLSDGEKYKLLKDYFKTGANYNLHKVFTSGCNRLFQLRCLDRYSWLVYSKAVNGNFCKVCVLCARNRNRASIRIHGAKSTSMLDAMPQLGITLKS